MKMELIAALIHRPKLVFLDEPTIGLDIISQKKIREFFNYYNQQHHTTFLLTSHYMEDIENLCRRVIIINQGQLVYDGDLSQVNPYFAQFKNIKLILSEEVRQETLAGFGRVKEYTGFTATLEIQRQDLKEISKSILDRLPVVDFNIEDIPVEDGISLLFQRKAPAKGTAPA